MRKLFLLFVLTVSIFGVETKDFKFLTQGSTKIKKVYYYNQPAKVLVVLVKDDGTRRDGYAESVSLDLLDKGFTTKEVEWIYVKDAKTTEKQLKDGYGEVLGKARMAH